MNKSTLRTTLPLAISLLALVMALGGTSFAAKLITGKDIKNGSVTGQDIKNSSVTGKDIKRHSLGSGDISARTLAPKAIAASGWPRPTVPPRMPLAPPRRG